MWIAQLQHLASAARTWSETDDADGELYRGSRLEAVLEALPERARELNEDEMAFVEASRLARDAERERERRTNRRLRRLLTAAVCLVVVAMLAGLLAYNRQVAANRSRRSAEITTLTSRSEALRSSNRDAAALLAIEANRLRPDDGSRAALFSTFTRDPGFLGYHFLGGPDGARVQGALVPNSNTAIVSIGFGSPETPDTPLRAVDLTTGEEGAPFEAIDVHDYMINVAVSADGRVAVAYGHQIFNGTNPRRSARLSMSRRPAPIGPRIVLSDNKDQRNDEFNVAVNAKGTQIAVGGGTFGEVRVFDVRSGELLTTIDPPGDMLTSMQGRSTSSASWAPDGTLYVGSSGTHLRQFDPETFELMRDLTVPEIATGGTMQFSPDGAFVVAGGTIQTNNGAPGSVTRIDLTEGTTVWTIDPDQYAANPCDVFTFSVPEDRLWCADYSGVIRGRSLSTRELDGTTVEHQRSGLTSMAVQTLAGTPVSRQLRDAVALHRPVADRRRWSDRRAISPTATATSSTARAVDGCWDRLVGRRESPVRCRLGHGRSSSPHPARGHGRCGMAGRRTAGRRHRGWPHDASSTCRRVQHTMRRSGPAEMEPDRARPARGGSRSVMTTVTSTCTTSTNERTSSTLAAVGSADTGVRIGVPDGTVRRRQPAVRAVPARAGSRALRVRRELRSTAGHVSGHRDQLVRCRR